MPMGNQVGTARLSQRRDTLLHFCRDSVSAATEQNHVGNFVGTLAILPSNDGLPTSKKSWASVVAPWITDAPTPTCIS